MADTELYCTRCCEKTPHTHLAGRTFICGTNGCGAETRVKDAKAILAEMEERKRANQEAVAKRNRAVDETNPAPAEPIAAQTETPATDTETNETTKETDMRKRLTDEEKTDIARRYQEGATVTTLAADFHVSGQCIRTVVKKLKAQRGRKPGRVAKAARPEAGATQAGGLKAAIQALVEEAVERRFNALEKSVVQLTDADMDAKVEAALARALK